MFWEVQGIQPYFATYSFLQILACTIILLICCAVYLSAWLKVFTVVNIHTVVYPVVYSRVSQFIGTKLQCGHSTVWACKLGMPDCTDFQNLMNFSFTINMIFVLERYWGPPDCFSVGGGLCILWMKLIIHCYRQYLHSITCLHGMYTA